MSARCARVTAEQFSQIAGLVRRAACPETVHARRSFRPAVRPLDAPGAWWRYAISTVRCDVAQGRHRLSWRWLRARIKLRRAYEYVYATYLHERPTARALAPEPPPSHHGGRQGRGGGRH